MGTQYFVYILSCEDNSYYKGIISNIERRFDQHMHGQCNFTKNKNPQIVFVQICEDRLEARKLEKYLKSGSGREIIKELY